MVETWENKFHTTPQLTENLQINITELTFSGMNFNSQVESKSEVESKVESKVKSKVKSSGKSSGKTWKSIGKVPRPLRRFTSISVTENVTENVIENVTVNVTVNVTGDVRSSVRSLSEVQLTKRQQDILGLIKKNTFITGDQMSEVLSVVPRTIWRDLADLQKKGVLIREGNTSAGHWVIIE